MSAKKSALSAKKLLVKSCPTYEQIHEEEIVAQQFKRVVHPSKPLKPEVRVGSTLIPRNPRDQFKGAGPRKIDLGSDREYATPPYSLIEAKLEMSSNRMDSVLGSLIYEQALAARSWGVPQRDLQPIAVFSGAKFDVYDPPKTIRTWVRVADRAGIEVWVGTAEGFVRLTDVAY